MLLREGGQEPIGKLTYAKDLKPGDIWKKSQSCRFDPAP
jgi:hypothetical protein